MKRGTLAGNASHIGLGHCSGRAVDLCEVDEPASLDIATKFGRYDCAAYFLESALSLHLSLQTLDRGMNHVARELSIETLEVSL